MFGQRNAASFTYNVPQYSLLILRAERELKITLKIIYSITVVQGQLGLYSLAWPIGSWRI